MARRTHTSKRAQADNGRPSSDAPGAPKRRIKGESTPRRERIENEIIEQASRLFAERGFAGTSLQDLADAMGITRSALYYYVKSKEDILARLVSDITQHVATEINAIAEDPDRTAAEKLTAIARLVAFQRAADPLRFLFLVRSEAALPVDLASANKGAEREIHRSIVAVLEAGVQTGEFRTVEPRTSALAVVGMCNWIAWWARARDTQSASDIADMIADLALSMVVRNDDRVPLRPTSFEALALVHEDLALLEQTLTAERR